LGGSWHLTIAYLDEHAVDAVQRLEHHVHQLGINLTLALAQDVEDVFGYMTAGYQRIQLQEAGATLDGMEATEDGIEQIGIAGAAFQFHQLLRQQLQNLPGLHQKILENLFIRINAHLSLPQNPRLDRRSSTSSCP